MLLYKFNFNILEFEIPFTNYIFHFNSPIPLLLSFGSILIYLLFIYIIIPNLTSIITKNKILFNNFTKLHFFLLFLYSGICCFSTLYYLYKNNEFINLNDFMCKPLPDWLRLLSLTFIISKIWEWVDTFIDIWRGKTPYQIGFLHCYHHATTFFLFLLVENFPSTEKSGMLLNGFVHTLMYYHYAFRLPKFMRPLITFFQIVQLVTVTYIWHITPLTCSEHALFPKEHFIEFIIPYGLVPVYAIFFVKFFIESYILPKKKQDHHNHQQHNKKQH